MRQYKRHSPALSLIHPLSPNTHTPAHPHQIPWRQSAEDRATLGCTQPLHPELVQYKVSKVSSLPNVLHKITVELTFEKFYGV